jgi:hypothetical protein
MIMMLMNFLVKMFILDYASLFLLTLYIAYGICLL